jgi:pyruvate-ferredoxin/flavodoxin oxidoreductase
MPAMNRPQLTIDGNEMAAAVAHRLSEVIAIYPITPSSAMGESADEWSAKGQANLWGTVPHVIEMQSEGGAAGAVHGALQTGSLCTTFTASQGLLLMLPNMFKIAGELTPTVFHISARTLATHALSIFGDHSDVMAARTTGFAMLASGSVQEVGDMACIAHAATLRARVPFMHFFDGFRTSHEVLKVTPLTDDELRQMIDAELVAAHRSRGLNPENPMLRGSAQNPDVFFQAREGCNRFYTACPQIVQQTMDRFAEVTGRKYRLFDYVGAPDAERVIVAMGSGAEVIHETVEHLVGRGEKVGLLKIRLFRPFGVEAFIEALPKSTRVITALDRTKEPGAAGEPLYLDVVTALMEHHMAGGDRFGRMPRVSGGRYGLSSKEFTPAMVKAVFDEMSSECPRNHFTIGIHDDVTHTSLEFDPAFSTEPDDVVRAMFYGLGSDGTVGANKNSIKIIGEETDFFAQGYFVYDSKKAGSVTVSHLRFGPRPIRSSYLISRANFIGCHHDLFLDRLDVLGPAVDGATVLLNSQSPPEEVFDTLNVEVQRQLVAKKIKLYVIDAYHVAQQLGMGSRINTIMQTCFFAISGVLPQDEAIAKIKQAIEKTYGKRGRAVVESNFAAVDAAVANMKPVSLPAKVTTTRVRPAAVSALAPAFVRDVTARIIAGEGDALPVSAMPCDGTFPTDTAQWEKRNIAMEIPEWDPDTCIQCNKCALVCPHASIRANVYDPALLTDAPATFKSTAARGGEYSGLRYTIQVAPEDCTGCGLCVEVCPAKNKSEVKRRAINMTPQAPLRDPERDNYRFFLSLPAYDRTKLKTSTVKGSQFMLPLFEYSGACAGCGETPYIKLATQLFGDRMLIANATGCSSIYGGNLPTTPYAKNSDGRGPAWSNSLFEDNAEFGLGYRLSLDKQAEFARELLTELQGEVGPELAQAILNANQHDDAGIIAQRERIVALRTKLTPLAANASNGSGLSIRNLLGVADALVKRSVWIIGGDGWAYDIGFGGLDHVMATGRNVNILVLDTEVYSNTGGQMSKSTPCGAVAKFAAAGKPSGKKNLSLMAMSYGNVYVAQVAMGANDNQTVKTFVEAESYDGPSLIIAYSHCIAHGINMKQGMVNQTAAVDCGHFPLFRYDPRRADEGLNPMQLDSKPPKTSFRSYAERENRYMMLVASRPERAEQLLANADRQAKQRYALFERMADNGSSAAPKNP